MSGKSSNLPYLITSVFAIVVIITAWTGRTYFEDRVPGPGAPAPAFEIADLEGSMVTLRDFEDKVVLLNVWATWCPPCIYEMPSMQRLYDMFEGEPFEIVAVSVDGRRSGTAGPLGRIAGDPGAFADSLGLTFPILHDPDGRIMRTYRTVGVPESFVIGRDGTIYRKVSGATEWDHPSYVQFIRRLIAGEG
jgi:cytochrome c biogenesis protein CcmG, thiol:disulfide interchange protein DsbE